MLQIFTSNEKSLLYVLHTMLNLHCMYLCNGPEDGLDK